MSVDVAAPELIRPWWRRVRLWLGLALVVVVGGVVVGSLAEQPGRPLDPASPHKDGSKAIARLLDRYGATLRSTSSIDTAGNASGAVVVTAPDEYSDGQLARLAEGAGRLVLVAPGTRAVAAVAPGVEPSPSRPPADLAGCADGGAIAAGTVSFPGDTLTYLTRGGETSCFGGALLLAPRLAVLGSASLLRNDHVADAGVAALDINAITDSRRITSVFWWLLAVGVLLAVWRARRLGPVVSEPLPVVVHAAEVVEGHGRLYARAGARDRAAAALRAAALRRIAARLGLPRGARVEQVELSDETATGVRREFEIR
jgi:hypothetical protein